MKAKSFPVTKQLIWDAFRTVKARGGGPGIDGQSIEDFEGDLANNLYKIWNRMTSGAYFPPPVKAVEIPKKTGGVRMLGVPTVSDRVAQAAVKIALEPRLEEIFDRDSWGYRPGRSAHDAIALVRKRSWKYDWVVEFDIKGLFDNIDHGLLLKALRKHCEEKWILLYVERWLVAPTIGVDRELQRRSKGTPQGGVVSPLLANLFLHYALDQWIRREMRSVRFCRYADDAVIHCKSQEQARLVLRRLKLRLQECGLELHPEKTSIVYCADVNRRETHENIQFTFLGYTFRPRRCVDKHGRLYPNFLPAVSRGALKAMRQEVRSWHLQLKCEKSLQDLSMMFNARLRGWYQYYGKFYPSGLDPLWKSVNAYLLRWLRRKKKGVRPSIRRAAKALAKLRVQSPEAFVHWQLGYCTQTR